MATLVYNRIDKEFYLLHGNDSKYYYTCRKDPNYFKDYEVPSYEDILASNLKILTPQEYFDTYVLANVDDEFKWLYSIHNVGAKITSKSNTITYRVLSMNSGFDYMLNEDLKKVKGLSPQTLKTVYKFFGMSHDYVDKMDAFLEAHRLDSIIVKRHIKLTLYKLHKSTNTIYALIKGDPIQKSYTVQWKKRNEFHLLPLDIPKYYKKEFATTYIGGTEGEYIVWLDFRDFYPNLYSIDPRPYKWNEFPDSYDIDIPCTYNEEQLALKNEQERIKKEKERKAEEEIERLKETPGYCDFCGAPHASWVADPCTEELSGIIEMHWMCDDCYNSSLGDI